MPGMTMLGLVSSRRSGEVLCWGIRPDQIQDRIWAVCVKGWGEGRGGVGGGGVKWTGAES